MSDTSDALEALLAHPGWRLYVAHVGAEWGPKAYAEKLKAAVSHARSVGKDLGTAIESVDAGNEAIAEAMRWPAEQLGRLKRADTVNEPSLSRRGGL